MSHTADCALIQATDAGVDFFISLWECDGTTKVDVSAPGSSYEIKFKSPLLTTFTVTADLAPGETNKLVYTTDDDDFTAPGTWEAQAIITMSGGIKWRSRVVTFRVGANL